LTTGHLHSKLRQTRFFRNQYGLFRQPPSPFFRQQTNRQVLVFQPGQGGGGAMPSATERLNGFYSSAYIASASGGELAG
jgi:hypothetical protein